MALLTAVTRVCRLVSWPLPVTDGRFCLARATVMRSIAFAAIRLPQEALVGGELDLLADARRGPVCDVAYFVGNVSSAEFRRCRCSFGMPADGISASSTWKWQYERVD